MVRIFNRLNTLLLAALLLMACTPKQTEQYEAGQLSQYLPWESLGELFQDVQMAGIYPDSKTFVDSQPKRDPEEIAKDYQKQRKKDGFALKAFVEQNFQAPAPFTRDTFQTQKPFEEHLSSHWAYLTREAGAEPGISTLIPLPRKYVVPGGRFREIYYWDSYFTMIGLGASGQVDLVGAMVENFAYLIDSLGFIPNGNRTYYLGRSQPPFFSSMVVLYMQLASVQDAIPYLPALQQEYDFWMNGAEKLTEKGQAINRVVRLENGTLLNRYWDNFDMPRPESYREDYELAEKTPSRAKDNLYRDLRAGAESGWDYSTRWFADKEQFSSIRTTAILPVDLNCLLFHMEQTLGVLYEVNGEESLAAAYSEKAEQRKQAIQAIFWNEEAGGFTDYIWKEQRRSEQVTLAGAYPLYYKVATLEQAEKQALLLEESFLLPGGLVTTTIASGQQWDYPNGWAPLQWIAIKGLEHYGQDELADEIARRWLRTNRKVFENTGKMMEKYNVADTTLLAGGGEYPTQDGFGWTNGVAIGLLKDNPVY